MHSPQRPQADVPHLSHERGVKHRRCTGWVGTNARIQMRHFFISGTYIESPSSLFTEN